MVIELTEKTMNVTGETERRIYAKVYERHGLRAGFLSDPSYRMYYAQWNFAKPLTIVRIKRLVHESRRFLNAHQRGETPLQFKFSEIMDWLREAEKLLETIE